MDQRSIIAASISRLLTGLALTWLAPGCSNAPAGGVAVAPGGSAASGGAGGQVSGTLEGFGKDLLYRPRPDFVGVDGFTFIASDGVKVSEAGSVQLAVVTH